MDDDPVVEVHRIPDEEGDGPPTPRDVEDVQAPAETEWSRWDGRDDVVVYYYVNRVIGRMHSDGPFFVRGEWWPVDAHTTIHSHVPLSPNHGRCHVTYAQDRQVYHPDVFYRVRGLNPSSVSWEVRDGDRSIDCDDTFFIHGTPSEQDDGTVSRWIRENSLMGRRPISRRTRW